MLFLKDIVGLHKEGSSVCVGLLFHTSYGIYSENAPSTV